MRHLLKDQSQEPINTFLQALIDRDRRRALMFISTLSINRKIGATISILPETYVNGRDALARKLLTIRATYGSIWHNQVRHDALPALAETWPDETTLRIARPAGRRGRRSIHSLCSGSGVGREVARRGDAAPCSPSGLSRMTTMLPAALRFRRWSRSGPTRRRAPCSPRGRPRRHIPMSARRASGVGREVARRGDAPPCSSSGLSRMITTLPAVLRFRRWPRSGPTRRRAALLEQRAVQDDHGDTRGAALQALAKKWPDETTRALLEQRAVQDDHGDTRGAALQALAKKWPDETTCALLEQRAVQDDHKEPRRAALNALAEKWPDETTRPPCSPSGPSRIRTVRCGARFFCAGQDALPVWPHPANARPG